MKNFPKIVHGSRDLLDAIRDAEKQAIAGELQAVVVISLTGDDFRTEIAWKEDMEYPFSRIAAALGSGYHAIQSNGLPADE